VQILGLVVSHVLQPIPLHGIHKLLSNEYPFGQKIQLLVQFETGTHFPVNEFKEYPNRQLVHTFGFLPQVEHG
jgi:hypothetical protein